MSLEETMRLREEIASILEHEKDERHNYFKGHLPDKWQYPEPIVKIGTLQPPQASSATSSKGRSAATTYESGGLKLTTVPEEMPAGETPLPAW